MQANRTLRNRSILNILCNGLVGLMLCVCAMAAYAQDNPQEKAIVNEIWKARAEKNTETVASKIEELKQINPKSDAISVNELWVNSIKTESQIDSPLKQPDNWVPKVQPTPVPTPRPTPVPAPIIIDKNSGSWSDKAMGLVKQAQELPLYWQIGAGVGLLLIILLIVVAIRKRRAAEPEPVSTESLLGGSLSPSPLGGMDYGNGNDFNIPSLDPLANDVTEPLMDTPATSNEKTKATVPPKANNAKMPTAGSMTDSTVNLFKSFEANMDSFTKSDEKPEQQAKPSKHENISMDDILKQENDLTNEISQQSAPKSSPQDLDLTALFAQDPNGDSESTTVKDVPTANNVDLTSMFTPESQKPEIPSIAPQAKTPSDTVDLTALFAQNPISGSEFDDDPFGKQETSADNQPDEGGEAFYEEQKANARKAIDEGRFKEAINFLSIVTTLNPDDAEAQNMLKEAQSKL